MLAAGTKIEQDVDKDKPIPVTVVTLLVDPEEAERLTLASTEGKIQLALRNPLDKATPVTRGIKPAGLCSGTRDHAASARQRRATVRQPQAAPAAPATGPPSKSSAATNARTKSCASGVAACE